MSITELLRLMKRRFVKFSNFTIISESSLVREIDKKVEDGSVCSVAAEAIDCK